VNDRLKEENDMKQSLIIIAGPTAVGKSSLSIELAKQLNGEIISADSMQVYKGMDIGTAKLTKEEMCGIPHYLIDEYEPEEEFNVVLFQKRAKEYINDISKRGKLPILVGGTGFYIQSVLYDISFSKEENDNSYRKKLWDLSEEKGADFLHSMLFKADEQAANEIHKNNIKKVIRALEYHHLTGEQISKHNERERRKESPYQYLYFVLTRNRSELYRRIDIRVDQMFDKGLIDEVKGLKDKGCHSGTISMNGLGYKEVLDYLNGKYTLEETKHIIKRETRHFAKRQLTWFKRERNTNWISLNDFYSDEEVLEYVLAKITLQKGFQ
jgi:tRNA dimethylallyltransferase